MKMEMMVVDIRYTELGRWSVWTVFISFCSGGRAKCSRGRSEEVGFRKEGGQTSYW